MQRGRGGYTIIEVMVVLAVGMVTFIAAVSLFAGKQGKTEFSQAMRDIQTKIQSIVNDVGVSNFPAAGKFTCSANGGQPTVSNIPSDLGSSEDCIFVGKAVHIIHQGSPDRLNIYTVLGSRETDENKPPTTYDSDNVTGVNPESYPDIADFVETYNLPFGVTVESAHEDTDANDSTYLLGFYNSLQASAATDQGSQSLTTIGYVGFNSPSGNSARTSIRGSGSGGVEQRFSKSWTICLQSGTSEEEAELVVNSSFSGVTTIINYTNC